MTACPGNFQGCSLNTQAENGQNLPPCRCGHTIGPKAQLARCAQAQLAQPIRHWSKRAKLASHLVLQLDREVHVALQAGGAAAEANGLGGNVAVATLQHQKARHQLAHQHDCGCCLWQHTVKQQGSIPPASRRLCYQGARTVQNGRLDSSMSGAQPAASQCRLAQPLSACSDSCNQAVSRKHEPYRHSRLLRCRPPAWPCRQCPPGWARSRRLRPSPRPAPCSLPAWRHQTPAGNVRVGIALINTSSTSGG